MKKFLNEAFKVSKKYDLKGNPIAYIDPNLPENSKTFDYKDIFKKNGAKWDSNGKYWFWYIGKTEDQWRNVYKRFIEPALRKVHELEGTSEDDSKESLIASLDAIVNEINSAETSSRGDGMTITNEEKSNLIDRLSNFKEMIVNLDNDEEFKRTMQIITSFKNAQGHKYSFRNTLLIWIQNPNAKLVKSEYNWNEFNRKIIDKNKRMIVCSPAKDALKQYDKNEKNEIIKNYLISVDKRSFNDLTAGQKEELGIKLRGKLVKKRFEYTPVYDVSNTEQIEGKKNLLGDYEKYQEIKWFEDDMISEEVKPIYNALVSFCNKNGIKIINSDDLGGARGASGGGYIKLLKNEGNDIGITKTLAHEITHELLHQRYLKDNKSEFAKYFVGTSEGRGLVEQQAELSAWMILASYGFDLKTTSFNYVAIWGADKDAMIKVFDTVTNVVNMLLDYINKELGSVNERDGDINLTPARHITPMDLAKTLDVESDYREVLQQNVNNINESFYSLLRRIN